jgi:hypothetical protein
MSIETTVPTQYSHSGGDHILASLGFGHTFGLTTSGPVFALDPGETVNSPSLGLMDNHFTPVPEPATAFVLGAGLLALAVKRRAASRSGSDSRCRFEAKKRILVCSKARF